MRSRLDGATEAAVAHAVTEGWHIDCDEFAYLPEGGGAYHWIARTADGTRWFVTCDDLDTKPWLGSGHDAVFDGLLAAYSAAIELHSGGASFVVAPLPSASGRAAVRIDDRYSVSVFEHVDGTPGRWGEPLSPPTRFDLVALLAQLHTTSASASGIAPRPFAVPDRDELDCALEQLDEPWDAGPLSGAVRDLLASHCDAVREYLADIDRTAARVDDIAVVVTHGEPHPGNLIHTSRGLALVDWDTVALAPPERDLWMLAAVDFASVDRYEELTGRSLDRGLLEAFRVMWAMTDLASFTVQLRREHVRNVDNERALVGLQRILASGEPRPFG